MCNPALIAMAASTAMQVRQGQQNQAAQLKVQKRASDKEQQRFLNQASAERIQEGFEAEQRAGELEAASTKVREARATARTAAGESGVAGNSVDVLLDQYTKQGAALRLGLKRQGKNVAVSRNLRLGDFALASENNQLRINQPAAGVDYAAAIGNGISTYSSVNSAWSDYKANKGTKAPTPAPVG